VGQDQRRKSIHTERYRRLRKILVERRNAAGLTQSDLARLLKRPQSFVSKVETGERRIDLIEFLEIARTLKFDPVKAIRLLSSQRQ
jgi:transcriptional regulator with XRE-family HTH domain